MKRNNSRLDSAIPISQAEYRKNRSTTEHVFATKLIIEMATYVWKPKVPSSSQGASYVHR